MGQFYYIAMQEDGSLMVATAAEAIPFHKDDLFGPYRTFQEAADAAVEAEWWLWSLTSIR